METTVKNQQTRYHLMSIPVKWRSDAKSPLYRHLEGANFAFADGHVKWLRASGWKKTFLTENGLFCSIQPNNALSPGFGAAHQDFDAGLLEQTSHCVAGLAHDIAQAGIG
jgi:prepilin-type processing-associated H-X9-DG protein